VECRICLGEHNAEIHHATLAIHGWLRARLRRVLGPPPVVAPKSQPYVSNMSAIKELRSPASKRKEAIK
jgi:hypothetical protein